MKKREIKKKKINFNNFVYSNFKQSLRDLRFIKPYIIFSSALFLIITIFGVFFPVFFVEQIFKLLEEIIKQTQGLNTFEIIVYIISNNIKSSFFALITGILFAIIPFMVIIVNAYVLGFVINKAIIIGGPLIIWRLFPHGIFEIPAVLISISLGLRLGLFLFVYKEKGKLKEFSNWIIQSVKIFIFIVIPTLVIAGIIEGLLIGILD